MKRARCQCIPLAIYCKHLYTFRVPTLQIYLTVILPCFQRRDYQLFFMLAFSFSFPVIIHNQYQLLDFNHTQVKNTAIVSNAIAYLTIYAISLYFTD